MDYLLAVRSKFGEGNQANVFGTESEAVLASGPKLPSSGPGLFIVLAGLGFFLMVIGAIRRA